jgi:DNA-binding NtrC family response regulator
MVRSDGKRTETMPQQIILVEDSDELRYAYAKLLEREGYVVHQFVDYRGVTELLDDGTGDVLLTDIVLPKGTPHGVAIAAMVRMHRPGIPVIFVTGYANYMPYVPADATVLIKPVPDDIMQATVAAILKH